MSVDHLKSVTSIGNVDDTSLALASISQGRSGPQRVLEQVQSIRRTRSRHASSRSGSTSLSPTSPLNADSVFTDGFRSQSNTTNGSNCFSKSLSLERNFNRQVVNNSKGTSAKRSTAATTYQYERYAPVGSMTIGQKNTSRSEPDVGRLLSMPKPSAPSQRMVSKKSLYRTQRSTSQFITSPTAQRSPVFTTNGTAQTKMTNQFIVEVPQKTPKASVTDGTLKAKGDIGSNGNSKAADITMKDAVEYLSRDDEVFQHCGASYIQHSTFMDDMAKAEVSKLKGIPPLVALLRSPSVEVSRTAAAALRNLSFKSEKNKEEIQQCSGVSEAVAVLRDTNCVDLHKQLTGLLWNLSSADSMKSELLKSALPVLMEHVILPYTTGPNRASGDSKDTDVFLHATGCLRNLSSSQQSNRQAMRKCRGLVDSLVTYIKDCVEAEKTDNESVENCMCVLHNLTFQLESEAPALFSKITALAPTVNRSSSQSTVSPVGCFGSPDRSQEHKPYFDFPVIEDLQPNGAAWLIHSKTLQSYLSLLRLSQREEIQEASCGAMQNLTANEGIVSSVMTQTIVQKLNGLHFISPLINSKRVNLQRNAVALVGNFTKMPNLHSALARKGLPELISLLSKGTAEGNESDDNLAMACQTAGCLLMNKPEMSKNLLNNKLIKSLNDLSQNIYFPKSRKAASLLLYKLWSDKDLQSFLKKQGMSKSSFVNDATVEAHRSLQVID